MHVKMLQLMVIASLFLPVSIHAATQPPNIIMNPPRDLFYKPGETVEVPCLAEGNPKVKYLWTRNKMEFNPAGNNERVVQLPNKGTLVFNSPEEKDEGFFQCFAQNDFGTSVGINCNMRVAKLAEFDIKDPEIHRPQLGGPLTIKCNPPQSIPNADVVWILTHDLGYNTINYDNRITMDREFKLQIAHVTREDEQNGNGYACMAMNDVMRSNVQSHSHYIEVQGAGKFVKAEILWADPSDLFALRGDTFSMQCIFSGNPTPNIEWERSDNKSMPAHRFKLMMYSQMLQIENLQPEDAGTYKCSATNDYSGSNHAMTSFKLRVASRPYFIEEPKDVQTAIGSDAEFSCQAGGNPGPEINWFINGLPLNDPKLIGKRFSRPISTKLFFPNVTQEDNMVIQCNASNKYGYAFSDVFLNVMWEAPEFITPPKSQVISAEGLDVDLMCETSGKPDPIVTWYKDHIAVSGGRFQILENGTLHIKKAVLSDASHYSCDARNIHGQVAGEGTLVIRRKTRIEQKPGDLERNAGMDAKFTCSGTTDPEEVNNLRVYWLKDGDEILTNDQRMTTNYQDNSLTISGTIVRDSGTYTCVATNGLDKAKASAVLTVRDKPDAPVDVHQEKCSKNVTINWLPGSFNNAPLQYYILQYNTSFNPDQWTVAMNLNGSWTKVSYELSPWVSYSFRLIAYNKIGPSSPSVHTQRECSTQEAVPGYNPKNLRTLGFQRNTLYIEWTRIPEIQHNAPGFYYYVTWLRVGESILDDKRIVNWTKNFLEVDTGFVYTRYKITIKAGNNQGEASDDATTIIGHTYEDAPGIEPTNFVVEDEGDTFATFRWEFETSEIGKVDTLIRGEFMGFKIQFWQEGDKVNTIREFDVGPDSAANITGNTFVAQVDNMLPNTNMEARISVKNNYYIGKPSETIRFKTLAGFPGPVDYFRVINVGDTHVNLDWRPPLENRGDLQGYDISYQLVDGLELGEMQEREPQINDPFTSNGILSGLQPRRKYRSYIYARTNKGRGEGYFIEFFTSKPIIPEIPDFFIPHITSTSINVSWWIDAYSSSGSVIFVEYRKLDGAEWLRSSDEVVNTWQKISNLEPGTKYEVRIKATNGRVSIPSSIEEVMTDGNAKAYDLVENIVWFVCVVLSELLIIGIIVLFVLCWKNGFRFDRIQQPDQPYNSTSVAYSGTYDHTAQINKGEDPKGYNNDYYNDKDNYDYNDGDSMTKPPSYSSEMAPRKAESAPNDYNYEDYDQDGYNRDYEGQDYPERRDYYDRRDDQHYDGQDDGYDYNNRDYDNRDYDNRDYEGQDYDRRDDYRDDGYNRRAENYPDQGYDYDSEEPSHRPSKKGAEAPSSTFV